MRVEWDELKEFADSEVKLMQSLFRQKGFEVNTVFRLKLLAQAISELHEDIQDIKKMLDKWQDLGKIV